LNADQLDSLDSLQFLRSDTSDNYTSGTLAFNSGTTLDVNGDLTIADTAILLDGASTEFTATGDVSFNTNDLFIKKSNGYVGIGTSTPSEKFHLVGGTLLVDNPGNLALEGTYDTSGSSYGIYIFGKYAYVADSTSGLQIIDISDHALPTLEGAYNTNGYAFDVYVSGKYAYIADYGSGLQIIDVSDPSTPTFDLRRDI